MDLARDDDAARATLILAATTDVSGLPALPAICIGFLLRRADLLWTALRRAAGRPAGSTAAAPHFYDLDADVIERTPPGVVLLTRERPPRTAVVEAGRLTLDGADLGEADVHDLPNGVVVVPLGETEYSVHPGNAADEDKVERLTAKGASRSWAVRASAAKRSRRAACAGTCRPASSG